MHNHFLARLYHSLFMIFILAPIVIVIIVSFTSKGYISFPSEGLSLRWYRAIWQDSDMTSAFVLSFKTAISATIITLLVTIPCAFALVKGYLPGKSLFTGIFMSPLMIPHVVLGIALLQFFSNIGQQGSFFWLVLAHVSVIFPYALRLLMTAISGIDVTIEQAAQSLGIGPIKRFLRITIPLLMVGILSSAAIAFVESFDELTMTMFIATPGSQTLPVALYNHIAQTIDPLVTSVSAVMIMITFLLALLINQLFGLQKIAFNK